MNFIKNFVIKIKGTIKKISEHLFYSDYVKEYLFVSDVRSSIYLSVVVSALEIWMLINVISGVVMSDGQRSFLWTIQHTCCYLLLLSTAVIMFIYAILYLNGKIKNKLIGQGIKIFFSVTGLAFGLYISYISYDKSGQVFAFVTMEVFCLGLLIWHPFLTFIILTLTFGLYLYLQNRLAPLSYSIKINSFTLWIAMLMSGINIHHQRRIEAQKDENLEKLNFYLKNKSLVDELTGLANLDCFQRVVMELLQNEDTEVSEMRFVYIDLENFKNYNEKYGFRRGNTFLRTVGNIIKETFEGELTARLSDDHFVVFTKAEGLEVKFEKVRDLIREQESEIQLGIKAGIYTPKARYTDPTIALDHARYACAAIKKHFNKTISEYNEEMDSEFKQKKYIINNIDNAVENGWIQAYYQPVVWAENGKLCGVEALARWNDPELGFLSPAMFVPVLEEYHLIHKLDMCIMRQVCEDLHLSYKNHEAVIPASINFSRLDFELASPVQEIENCIKSYGLSKEDIHVEITESALLDSDKKLQKAMEDFRAAGYSLWLDDFGSGYSGLNVLKDFSFDMMKIDMKFLSQFSENAKTQPILSSVVSLAQKIGMQTLTEGVETEEARDFLRSIGCQRLQGYLFGKPMTRSELLQKIKEGVYDVSLLK
ncbi:diguanylate cyclase (GGDEF) domain-containing protein [Treponema sp. JC4]|uniref:bifunctional diguanylate cyclase/phosphodiesterase n=1 Tax=Treponema sp. JC4 TaxID=1124982 RepID=UPI00025B0264|nr:bifunctional diguanylate cyclase/phosphodiesterase [Treponema sp. JC4]EID86031.1 diguanylate cyclase (GGDEF) domain-containing protein [Treponema sp. JC4]